MTSFLIQISARKPLRNINTKCHKAVMVKQQQQQPATVKMGPNKRV